MGLFSDRDGMTRQQLTNAQARYAELHDRDLKRGGEASKAFLAADDARAHAAAALPWWKRIGT
jgi:hypothetical protein